MFSFPLEREPSEEDVELPVEEEEEQEQEPDEWTVFLNEEIAQCFLLFDKNKNGTFETSRLEQALKCLGIHLTSVELEDAEKILDTDGVVPVEKFQTYTFEKLMEADAFDSLKQAFRVFDPDNEGVLPSDRLKRWLTTLGDPLTEKEAKEVVKLGDPAGKGFVPYDDLVGVLLAK